MTHIKSVKTAAMLVLSVPASQDRVPARRKNRAERGAGTGTPKWNEATLIVGTPVLGKSKHPLREQFISTWSPSLLHLRSNDEEENTLAVCQNTPIY